LSTPLRGRLGLFVDAALDVFVDPGRMCAVNLSCFSKRASGEPLRRALTATSHRLDMEREQVEEVVAAFLEEVVDEVANGHVVSVPKFGAWAAWVIESPSALARDPSARCQPKFSPSRSFSEKVRHSAPATTWAKRRLARHRRNHALRLPTKDRTPLPEMTSAEIRASIKRQMADS
jgi:nucleoid DNA-binding protein